MNIQRNFAIIPAAGMGKRMGASINKQYLMLQGKPILAHTLQRFQDSPLIHGIIVVTPLDEIPFCQQEVVDKYNLSKVLEIVPGGAERQNSVYNGLRTLGRYADADNIVLIHDGVRPMVKEQQLAESIKIVRQGLAALIAVPAKDTIKVVKDGLVQSTPDRATLWQAQTPQAFIYQDILFAYNQAEQDGFIGTDDCSLFERYNGSVKIISGSYHNIKITTPEDLLLAEAFMSAAMRGDGG